MNMNCISQFCPTMAYTENTWFTEINRSCSRMARIQLLRCSWLAASWGIALGLCVRSVMSDSLQLHGLWPTRLLIRGVFLVRILADCHFLLQRIFPTQGSNPHLLPGQRDPLSLRHMGALTIILFITCSQYIPGSTNWEILC